MGCGRNETKINSELDQRGSPEMRTGEDREEATPLTQLQREVTKQKNIILFIFTNHTKQGHHKQQQEVVIQE